MYFVREAVVSLRRNGLMTVAAVTTLMVALLTVGTAVLLGLNLTHLAAALEAQVQIVAFLRDGLSEPQIRRLQRTVATLPGVTSVQFVGRSEALARLRQRLGTAALTDLESSNPLPDSLEVRVSQTHPVPDVASTVARQPGVQEVTYGAEVTERLVALTHAVRAVAALLTLLLASVALVVVANTIRLTVIARRQEIEIMELVGATRWFIRWPFFLEGILQGAGAAVGAALVLLTLYALASLRLSASLPFLPVVSLSEAVQPVALSVLTTGVLVGAFGSMIAVRRFLSP